MNPVWMFAMPIITGITAIWAWSTGRDELGDNCFFASGVVAMFLLIAICSWGVWHVYEALK